MDFKNKGYWALLLLVIISVFLYRSVSQGSQPAPDPQQLSVLQEEMDGLWSRIPSYPGSKAEEPRVDATPERIVWERLQATDAPYEQARDYYQKELEYAGWRRVGEAKAVPGFASPIFLFSSGSYHLYLSKEPEGILLRMTWHRQADVLYDARIKP